MMAKVQELFDAIQRRAPELSRREEAADAAHPSQAGLARHALELKLGGQTKYHSDAGCSASEGKQMKERRTPAKIGTTRKEICCVSQVMAPARKDSPK